MNVDVLTAVEGMIHVSFRDKALLQRAFVHRSYLNELAENSEALLDNERLEFLGDAVLSYIFSELLYQNFPDMQEGGLTNLRAALVRKETLARIARKLHLGEFLLLGHGEEESGGRTRQATLCATFEALVGAVFLDQGIDVCRDMLLRLFAGELAELRERTDTKDPKSRLQEWAQATLNHTPRYRVVKSIGPDHDKRFITLVQINGEAYGVGDGRSKQEATQKAAAMALYRLQQPADEYVPNPELEAAFGLASLEGTSSHEPGDLSGQD
ncbi:MAG: ribonuclease III [Caldilineaceae bacterium]|nr:ribonuclease III [Caldilineaceae bacterium]